jgi:Protein of unknown function (DUF1460)
VIFNFRNCIHCITFLFLVIFFQIVFAQSSPVIIPHYNEAQYQKKIAKIYRTILNNNSTKDVSKHIAKTSAYFLNAPYSLGALGEGPQGKYDKSPLYRTDAFDCVTFVSTVLALVESNNSTEFVTTIKKIQYKNAKVSFVNRYHFIEHDWNLSNQKNGYLKNITPEISPHYRIATTWLNKPSWFRHLTLENIKLFMPVSDFAGQQLLTDLHNSHFVSAVCSHIDYIPLSELFVNTDQQLLPKMKIFNRIPSGVILEIIDKNRDTSQLGTDLSVVHLGFVIKTTDGLMFRHASSRHGKVLDVPLVSYLAHYWTARPDLVGIHIERVMLM